jgi:hypothetical protein
MPLWSGVHRGRQNFLGQQFSGWETFSWPGAPKVGGAPFSQGLPTQPPLPRFLMWYIPLPPTYHRTSMGAGCLFMGLEHSILNFPTAAARQVAVAVCMRHRRLWAREGVDHRIHRVATAAFWRTFSHEGKISPGWCGWGGARPPLFITFTITSKDAMYAQAKWADTLTLFHL